MTGKRGPKSNAPGGYGNISSKGYRRVWDTSQGRLRMEHDMVWEQHNGPIPEGMEVHHRDEDKLHNAIGNLELLDHLTHKRIHSGCELRDGEWWKPCRGCGEFKPVSQYYERKDGISSRCRSCSSAAAVEVKQRRRAEVVDGDAAGD